MPLNIEAIRAIASRTPRREVECPDLGGTVLVRGLTCEEMQNFQDNVIAKNKDRGVFLSRRLVEMAAIDEDGSPLFAGEDKAILARLSWPAVEPIAEAIMELSGMRASAGDDAKKD